VIAARLLAIEWFKTRRRFAFYIATFFWFVVVILMAGGAYYMHAKGTDPGGLKLPDAWKGLAGIFGNMMGLILIVLVSLLTASERSWRTERQKFAIFFSARFMSLRRTTLRSRLSGSGWTRKCSRRCSVSFSSHSRQANSSTAGCAAESA